MALTIGNDAPDFFLLLIRQKKNEHSREFASRKVVLVFIPGFYK